MNDNRFLHAKMQFMQFDNLNIIVIVILIIIIIIKLSIFF